MEHFLNNHTNKNHSQQKLKKDRNLRFIFLSAAIISSSMLAIIIVFITIKGIIPFIDVNSYDPLNIFDFLFGDTWRKDQGIYGVGFIIINTLLASIGALLIAFPLAVLTAMFIVKIAPKRFAKIMQTVVELLASVPSVVYGVFAAGTIALLVKDLASVLGYSTAGGSTLLTVIILLAIMIFPTITTFSITAISSVDKEIELGSLALGATQTQTNFRVILTSAKSGIFAGAILGLGRAFGEATAVAMVAGNKMFGPSFNLFDTTRTLTTTMLSGLKETTGLDYDIRFSVGLILMIVILLSNVVLNIIKQRVGKIK